jgi:REP element-mobilizing transposase RayT
MPDHVHLLIGMRPNQSISNLVQMIKGDSSRWINEKKFVAGKFSWQEGYGAFSYEKSQVPRIIKYIQTQEEHHQKRSFIDEYLDLLETFEIDYDEQFLFKPIE